MSQESGAIDLSIVIPAKNEAKAIGDVVKTARAVHPKAEIIVVDDGSTDATAEIAEQAGAVVVRHPESLGNGAAVKSGARAARGEILALMDGDGQHDAREFGKLIEKLEQGYDMAIGARDSGSHANVGRLFANGLYNGLASLISGTRILDLTSGFRVARASYFKMFLYLLPNGFSYPTTITMAFLRSAHPVCFEPITAATRKGKSHIRPIRDGVRFLVIIFKIATLYSPLKIFLPISGVFFATGLGYYAYTYFTAGRFTNMSLLVISAAVIIFLIGLISEQITALTYSKS
ncbi:MAG: glycosyltransferase family 2 protein [Gammaproteobacteria bacterium]|jgi:glycosyltransferase involved in cell wall biosynthesis|nr:glycosyltransferase family 2 protein [Gammaproteobacteria bacterium]MDH3750335.1 glycosyltransferase family 2 protein [Gammaproteobacteria bacterium]MDH3805251.1 glycosyltransferase family 2 protein [Gammaproteobacteria bacterium]